jgi:hypothetical protein
MVASLVRLLHSGPQDQRLLPKGGPNIDAKAYISVLVRAGRFTTKWHRLDFQQKPQFGQTAFCNITVKGELLTRLYLVVTLPDIYAPQLAAMNLAGTNFAGPRFGWTNSIGHALVASATIDIGGTRFETLDSRLLEIHDEFDTPLEKVLNKNQMIGRLQNGFTETSLGNSATPTTLHIPIPFWFSKGDLGAALPVDAIHVDDIRVGIQFRPLTGSYYTDSRSSQTVASSVEGSELWQIEGSAFYQIDTVNGSTAPPGLYPPPTDLVSVIPGATMPLTFSLGDTYLLAEYIYLDKAESNRWRLGDVQVPIVQHYTIDPKDSKGFPNVTIPMELANPVRHLYWMAQNYGAQSYNAHFLATRDLSGGTVLYAPWWPDCQGLNTAYPAPLVPGFLTRDSEPFTYIELVYEGSYVKTSTDNCALYRSILPSLEERKTPWHNRYMYCMPFNIQSGYTPPSVPMGEANMNRIMKKELQFGISAKNVQPERVWIYIYAETYNIFRVFGGRASMMFAY